jgi:hypothetical protein
MSANVYSIETLLVGTYYRSKTLSGEIVSAQKDERAVWYQDCESYLVEVKPDYGFKNQFRTVAVKVRDI